MGINLELSEIPEYGKSAHVSRLQADTAFSQMIIDGKWDEEGLRNFNIAVKSAFAGYYRQKTQLTKDGNLVGTSFFFGPSGIFEVKGTTTNNTKDWATVINVLGPTMDMTYYFEGGYVRATIDIYPSFAMVRSYVIDKYKAGNGLEGVKSTLRQWDYYAIGGSLKPRLEIQNGDYKMEIQYNYQAFSSIDTRDRHSEKITNNFSLWDTWREFKILFSKRIRAESSKFLENYPLWLQVGFAHSDRSGCIGENTNRDICRSESSDEFTVRLELTI